MTCRSPACDAARARPEEHAARNYLFQQPQPAVLHPLLLRTSPQSVLLRFQLPSAAEVAHARWNFTVEALSQPEDSHASEGSAQEPHITHLLTQPRGSVLPPLSGMMQAHRCGIYVSDLRKSASGDSGVAP